MPNPPPRLQIIEHFPLAEWIRILEDDGSSLSHRSKDIKAKLRVMFLETLVTDIVIVEETRNSRFSIVDTIEVARPPTEGMLYVAPLVELGFGLTDISDFHTHDRIMLLDRFLYDMDVYRKIVEQFPANYDMLRSLWKFLLRGHAALTAISPHHPGSPYGERMPRRVTTLHRSMSVYMQSKCEDVRNMCGESALEVEVEG